MPEFSAQVTRATTSQRPDSPWREDLRPSGMLCETGIPDHILAPLGLYPRAALRAVVDYGLSDAEIGRYYGIPTRTITALRHRFDIEADP